MALMFNHRQIGLLAAQSRQDTGKDQYEAVTPGIDDPRFSQNLKLLRGALHCFLSVADRLFDHVGEQIVLLFIGCIRAQPLAFGRRVGQLTGNRMGHFAEDGEHRAFRRFAD
ncbi:MAG: hypothetical protein IPK93_11555 [Solirubrobacterales bacterium]|nr:hypothetical protein [Solirubrobacterales bacterium]